MKHRVSESPSLPVSVSPTPQPGLYVHVPFCLRKCIYCDFYSVTDTRLVDAWLRALAREIELYRSDFTRFDSVYIGGGTPSVLDTGQMSSLFESVHAGFDIAPDAEITVEMNPDDADPEKLRAMKALGVNRLSLGVQSFSDAELSFLGRRHDANGAERAIEVAASVGFRNIGMDLMYGLPGQTRQTWLATLEKAVSFSPAHLSCYQLTLEGNTPLRRMIGRGDIHLPGEEEERRLFMRTARFLKNHGFVHYEVSNYAAGEGLFCRHNEKYWRHVPYLGLGPSAHSFDGTSRWWNHRSVRRYIKALRMVEKPIEGMETLSEEQLKLERLYLGFRTRGGVPLDELSPQAQVVVGQLEKAALVRVQEKIVRSSLLGYLVADSLPVLLS